MCIHRYCIHINSEPDLYTEIIIDMLLSGNGRITQKLGCGVLEFR